MRQSSCLLLEPRRRVARHLVDLLRGSRRCRSGPASRCSRCRTTSSRGSARPRGRRCRRRAGAATRRQLPTASRSTSSSAVRTSTSRSMPRSRSRAAVTGPTPHSASTGSFCRNVSTRSGAITVRPSGFFHAGRDLREELVRRDAGRRREPGRRRGSRAFSRCATVFAERLAPRVLGDVEIRLVERQRLDQRRHRAEDLEHLLRGRAVLLEVGPDDDQVAGRAGPRAPSGSPSARRTRAPRSSPPRRRRGCSGRRRRRPACRAAPGCRAARPTRRTRPCRRGECGGRRVATTALVYARPL